MKGRQYRYRWLFMVMIVMVAGLWRDVLGRRK